MKYQIEYEFPLQNFMEANSIHEFDAPNIQEAIAQAPKEWAKIVAQYNKDVYEGEEPIFVAMRQIVRVQWTP